MNQASETAAKVTPSPTLARRVTAFGAACLIVSNMIGSGIFGTTGFMARDLGQPWLILLLWAVGGMFALFGALCYAELGTLMPRVGGEYVYIREAFGPLLGFLSGWTSLTIGFSAAIASSAHLFAIHVHELFPGLAAQHSAAGGLLSVLCGRESIALIMVWTLTAVHAAGVGVGSVTQQILTIMKVGAIGLLIGAAVFMGKAGGSVAVEATAPVRTLGFSTILASFLFVSFSYTGFNAAGYIAGEMVNPRRSIPRATLAATCCVTALYLALNVVYLYALPIDQLAADPVAPVAHKTAMALFGPSAGLWITALLTVSLLGAVSAMIWAGPRVYFAMAQDRVLPRFFARTSSGQRAPVASIVLQSVWISVLVLSGRFEQLVTYTGFVLIVFTALAIGAVLVLRQRGETHESYRVRPYPLIPIAFLVLSLGILWAVVTIRPAESFWGIATVLLGVPVFFWTTRSTSSTRNA